MATPNNYAGLDAKIVQHVTVECEDGEKPVCVADVVSVLIR